MKKIPVWPLVLGFCIPFLTTAVYLYGAGLGSLDRAAIIEHLLLAAGGSLLISFFTACSSLIQSENPEQTGLQEELSHEAGILFRSIWAMKHRAFAPFWLVLASLVAGIVIVGLSHPFPGALLILAGQAFWLLARGRLRRFIDTAPMDNHLHPYLSWILLGMDAFAILSVSGILNAIGAYGEITGNTWLLGVSALSAALYTGFAAYRRKERLDAGHAIKAAGAFIWLALTCALLNAGFDFKEPRSVQRLEYRSCSEYQGLVLRKMIPAREEMLDCHYFSRMSDASLDSSIEVIHRAGALGAEWKQVRFVE